jgi:hypothetical protein
MVFEGPMEPKIKWEKIPFEHSCSVKSCREINRRTYKPRKKSSTWNLKLRSFQERDHGRDFQWRKSFDGLFSLLGALHYHPLFLVSNCIQRPVPRAYPTSIQLNEIGKHGSSVIQSSIINSFQRDRYKVGWNLWDTLYG